MFFKRFWGEKGEIAGDGREDFPKMMGWVRLWTEWFVAWVAVFAVVAYLYPPAFIWFAPYIKPGLGVIMFGMGMTLVPADFKRVATMPRAVVCGVAGQFLIMPLVAYGLAKALQLSADVAMGFVILGACPGGTASNVIAYLAKADVALSVTMTAVSTLLAVFMTPTIVQLLGGEWLPVDWQPMFIDVAQVVLVPVALGLGVRAVAGERAAKALDVFPAISVAVIVLIVATIVALRQETIATAAPVIVLVALAHNMFGLGLGYGLATLVRLPESARRTVAIEIGMQNSGLGVVLSTAHFPATNAALPPAFFSVIHNVTGSALASWWSRRFTDEGNADDEGEGA